MMDETLLPTRDDVRFYRDNGYWISPWVMPEDLVARVIEHMDRVIDGQYETGSAPLSYWRQEVDDARALRKIDNAYWADNTIRELALHPAIGAAGAMLAETPAVRLWHDQLLYKPGDSEAAGNVGWHQDYFYWQCTHPADMLTAWVALVDVDESNGCMQFVPGSHRWGLVEDGLDFFDHNIERQYEHIRSVGGESARPVNIVLRAGQVSFHHCLTLHGSGPNVTASPRRSLAIHLMPDHIRRRTGTRGDAHHNCTLFEGGDGDLWRGEHFPVIATLDAAVLARGG